MIMQRAMQAFAAGALGGLANSVAIWLCGALGITAALGVAIAPAATPAWLYPRLVWGGIWRFLLLCPARPRPGRRDPAPGADLQRRLGHDRGLGFGGGAGGALGARPGLMRCGTGFVE
jgi:hypothetical protein